MNPTFAKISLFISIVVIWFLTCYRPNGEITVYAPEFAHVYAHLNAAMGGEGVTFRLVESPLFADVVVRSVSAPYKPGAAACAMPIIGTVDVSPGTGDAIYEILAHETAHLAGVGHRHDGSAMHPTAQLQAQMPLGDVHAIRSLSGITIFGRVANQITASGER